jgi:hypothetical protein
LPLPTRLLRLLRLLLHELPRVAEGEETLRETVAYLNSEWFNTANDLKVALQDVHTWDAIKLPKRLKLALKRLDLVGGLLGVGSGALHIGAVLRQLTLRILAGGKRLLCQ